MPCQGRLVMVALRASYGLANTQLEAGTTSRFDMGSSWHVVTEIVPMISYESSIFFIHAFARLRSALPATRRRTGR